MDTFSELPQIWAAAWIDCRDDLLNATRQIMKVQDTVRRDELLFELSDIPVVRQNVDDEIAEEARITADHSQDPDVWRAKQRLNWAAKFSEHYNRIGQEAAEQLTP
jgi:hypothetical protein